MDNAEIDNRTIVEWLPNPQTLEQIGDQFDFCLIALCFFDFEYAMGFLLKAKDDLDYRKQYIDDPEFLEFDPLIQLVELGYSGQVWVSKIISSVFFKDQDTVDYILTRAQYLLVDRPNLLRIR